MLKNLEITKKGANFALALREVTSLKLRLERESKHSGCSSARFRVRVWGACGRKFESCHPD